MFICDDCKEQMTVEKAENSFSFPAFTVTGGLIGTVGALVGGPLLLVPATVVAGALVDTVARNCEMCGKDVLEDEPSYHLMEELSDEYGGLAYRPIAGSQGQTAQSPQRSYTQPFERDGFGSGRTGCQTDGSIEEFPGEFSKQQQPQVEYVFDEVDSKLVPRDTSTDGIDSMVDFMDGVGSDVSCDPILDNQISGHNDIDISGFNDVSGFEIDDLADGDSFGSTDFTLF